MRKTAVTGAAGAGKTTSMMESVSGFLKAETAASRILVLASSAHTINDIKTRFSNIFTDTGGDSSTRMAAPGVVIHTVRSLCEAALKDSDPELQILSDFRTWFILRECIRSGSAPIESSYINVKDKRSFTREVLELIESASINSISIDQLPSTDEAADKLEDIKNICRYYQDFCQQRGLVPAFDVISEASDLLSKYGQQFSHVFIDQYEDMYPGEIQVIDSLTGEHTNVTVFVDSGSKDILSAKTDEFEDIKELDGSHGRLSAGMSGHINRLLKRAVYPLDAEGDEQPLTIAVEENAVDEAEYIARTIKTESRLAGRKYSDFAILCREVERFGGALRDALKKHSIPCSGGADVSHNPGVRFVLQTLRVIAQSHEDDIVLKWLSSSIAGLDRADVYRAYTRAKNNKQNFLKAITAEKSLFHKSEDRLKELLSLLEFVKAEFQSGRNVWELVKPILAKMHALPDGSVTLFIEMIRDIETSYEKKHGLWDILSDIRRGLTQISAQNGAIYEDSDAVRIMSIRESKGLEFPFVFVPGMVSDFFPARHPARQLLYGEDLEPARAVLRGIDLPGTVDPARWREQERYLLYIAMTRAKDKLHLTFAHQYPDRGDCEPSPFLMELLDGKELSADNCAHYGIVYQDHTVSIAPDELPSLDDISSRVYLEIACYRYVRELERMDHEKAAEAVELLSGTDIGDLYHPASEKEVAIPDASSKKFSSSAIRNFLSCPRRYFLSYLPGMDSEDQPSAHFGRLVHDVLKEFHKEYSALNEYSLEELWISMDETLSQMWNARKESSSAGNRLQEISYLRLAGEILHAYLQGEHSRWEEGRSCVLTEDNFNFPFSDEYILGGRIDRVDECISGGNEIMDFKTSAYDKEGESAMKSKFLNMNDDPDYRPQDFQLPIYYFGGLAKSDLDPQKLVIYQLRNLSKTSGMPFRRELEILPDDDTRSGKKDKFLTKADLESVKGDILRTLERMVSGYYPPEPRDDNVCERECDFSFLCDREESEDH